MAHILIVNDDGAASPMLGPLAAQLAPLGRVSIVVPAEEQSWKGKAMTRYGRLRARPSEAWGVPAWVVTGTPSDCVNIAVHHLLETPPDWVLSGINIGTNVGLAYVIHSGTIAAALEGALQGVPAAAFSTYLPPALFGEWTATHRLTAPEARAVIETTTARTATMMAALVAHGAPVADAVVSVNFPGAVTPATPVHWVPLHESRYGALFRREGDGFVHAGRATSPLPEGAVNDRAVIQQGGIAASLISLASLGAALPPPERRPF